MANQPIKNTVYSAQPWNATQDTDKYFGGMFDPFNFSGWNSPAPVDTAGAQPGMPGYNPIYDPNTQGLSGPLQKQLNSIDLNPLNMSVQNYADMANRQGPSAWATQAGQQQDALSANARDRGASESNAQTATALDRLASSGGLSSGARERAAEAGNKNYMNMTQDIGRQDSLNQLQIGVNDQQNKIQELSSLPGIEASALAPQFQKATAWENAHSQDVSNQMNSAADKNKFTENTYQQQMQAWAANKQADATQNSGKHKGKG